MRTKIRENPIMKSSEWEIVNHLIFPLDPPSDRSLKETPVM
jgi:hypothetical protein